MLVLTRKNGESVRIGDGVEVTVLSIQGGRVKLGFSAPPDVPIQRDEIRTPAHAPSAEHVFKGPIDAHLIPAACLV